MLQLNLAILTGRALLFGANFVFFAAIPFSCRLSRADKSKFISQRSAFALCKGLFKTPYSLKLSPMRIRWDAELNLEWYGTVLTPGHILEAMSNG